MDFFEKQTLARRKSTLLVTYFVIAVVATVVVINLLSYLSVRYFAQSQYMIVTPRDWFDGPFWWLTLTVVGAIAAGSLWRFVRLRKGGSQVPLMMGALPVDLQSKDTLHRRLINVTEEMSIAAGTPIPQIFILQQETGINAFVAGYQLQDMTLTVSQGALENLSRDELQGVIAHEFSHIQNADTRLNMRIMALLAGLLFIGSIGSFLCRSAAITRTRRRFSMRSNNKGSGGIFAIGSILFLAGYTGLLFGRFIQAAVSRQREWLADATAVQYTRNPDGISGALSKIADNSYQSWLDSANAQEVNHMCFSEALKLRQWLASHPPLDQRIKAINPMFLTRQRAASNAEKVKAQQVPTHPEAASFAGRPLSATAVSDRRAAHSTAADSTASDSTDTGSKNIGSPLTTSQTISADQHTTSVLPDKSIIGTVPEQNYALGHQILNRLKQLFGDGLHNAVYAEALLYTMVLRETSEQVASQLKFKLSNNETLSDWQQSARLRDQLKRLPADQHLSLLEIITSVLKAQPASIKSHIIEQTGVIIAADQRTTFAEFIMQSFIVHHLAGGTPGRTINSLNKVTPHLEIILSMFARLGTIQEEKDADKILFNKVSQLHYPLTPLNFRRKISGSLLANAVRALSGLNHHLKPILIEACLDCIKSDDKIIDKEYQLLRITVEMLDCPMPPLAISTPTAA